MSNKETKVRVANAFRAMKAIGISEDKVKPVLKNLLKLYDKKWELIEEENYRALADAIFEIEEAEAEEHAKKIANNRAAEQSKNIVNNEKEDNLEEEAQVTEEPERPLKRLRRKYRDDPSSSSAPNGSIPKVPLVKPKEEPSELPEMSPPRLNGSQGLVETHQPSTENTRVNQAVTCQLLGQNKGKHPISPKSLSAREGCDPCQPSAIGRNQKNTQSITEPRSPSHPMRLRDRGKGSVSPQTPSREKSISPKSLIACEGYDPCQPSATDRNKQNTQLITEPRSPSHPVRLRDRGNGSMSPQIPSGEKRSVPESSSLAICLKEPKVEPGVVQSPKQQSIASHPLVRPKDEPITDDMPHSAVPVAVIYPDPSNGVDSSGNGTIREHDSLAQSVSLSVNGKETTEGTANPNEPASSRELAMVTAPCSSNLEIASSPFGEVKISLNCDLALIRPDFRMPSLETFLKSVEKKCLRSYKTLDASFSVMNLMKEMCQCFLELGSDSSSRSPETINVTPSINLLNKSSATDAHGAGGPSSSPLNGSVDSHDAQATLCETPLPSPFCNNIDDGSHLKKMDNRDDCGANIEDKENTTEEMNNLSLVVPQQPQVTPEIIRSIHDVDIAKGQEKVVITLVNEVNNESPPSFYYIPQNAVFQNAYVNFSLARIGNKNCCSTCFVDCLSSSIPCACAHETGGGFAYTTNGLVKEALLKESISMNCDPKKHQFFCKECPLERSKSEDITEPCKGHIVRKFIKECWSKCGCNKQCGNRVVQRGITRNLQVFMTPEGKGWGLRTLEDLPIGAFVCEYVGEVLTNAELFDRVFRSPKREKHSYPVLLDADWGAEGVLKDEEALCLDATYFGNVARFINHKCYDSNLVEIPVEVETPDHHYYHLAFFTTRKVKAMEELTWDYGIDFDDDDHPIKAFRCQCGSKFCRNIKRSRSRAARR